MPCPACRRHRAAARFFGGLRRQDRGLRCIDGFFVLFAGAEIALGVYTGMEAVRAEQRTERGIDLRKQLRFDLPAIVQIRLGELRLPVSLDLRTVQESAARIDDRDRFGGQTVNRAGHQIGNRDNARLRQLRHAFQTKHDRRFGRLAGIEKNRLFRERNVDARLFDFGQSGNRTFQLPFERAAIVNLFGEIARSQVGAVEEFKTDSPGFGQTGSATANLASARCPEGTSTVEPVSSRRYSIPASRIFCVTARGVLGSERAERNAEIAFVLPLEKPPREGTEHDRNGDQRDLLRAAQRVPDF